jgi:hypothetical protein
VETHNVCFLITQRLFVIVMFETDRLCGLVVRFLTADPQVPGSISVAARFSEQQCVWNGVHSALLRINEELLERKVPVLV